MIWSGFVIGILGSWHCIAMCGPIALMVPGSSGKNRMAVITLYHSGKILAYLFIGSVFGLIPALIHSFTIQSVLMICVGVIMLALALIPALLAKMEQRGFKLFSRYFNLKNNLIKTLNKNKTEYSFFIGFLNGFVPCGMVYIAALGALTQPDLLSSTLYMFLFGLGTLPVMTLFLLSAGFFKTVFRNYSVKLRSAGFILTACFIIWKGTTHLNDSITPPKEGESFQVCTQLDTVH